MSIRTKLLVTFLAIAIIPMLIIEGVSLYKFSSSLKETTLKNLNYGVLAKKAQLIEYLLGKEGRTVDFASDGFIRDQAELISKTNSISKMVEASRKLNTHLKTNKKTLDGDIVETRVLDIQGKIIGTSEGEFMLGIDSGKNQPYFLKGIEKTYIQDAAKFIHFGVEKDVIAIGTPLKSRVINAPLGILVNFYSLKDVRDILLDTKSRLEIKPSPSGIQSLPSSQDIYLVNKRGALLSDPENKDASGLFKKRLETFNILGSKAQSPETTGSWKDYEGKDVLGAITTVQMEKDWKWFLVLKQDMSEIFSEIHALRFFTVNAGLITMLFVIIISALIAKSITRPLMNISLVADQISRGSSNARIAISSRNEIGRLAESFNRMLDARLTTEDLLKIANSKIGEEKSKYEMLLSSIGDGMIAVNHEGKIMLLNKAAEKIFGYSSEEIIGKSFFEVIPSEDEKGLPAARDQRIISMALSQQAVMHTTAYYFRKNRSKFPAAVTASPIIFEEKTIGAIGIFRDITKEKEVDRMKTDFISTVSHEIRTPLTTIREGVSQALDGILGEPTLKQKEVFSIVLEDTDRLKRIIDNLLDISKIESGMVYLKREMIDLVSLIKGAVSSFSLKAKEKNLRVNLRAPSDKISAFIDKDRIIQVFTNLIGNSLKFTPSGSIDITVSEDDKSIICAVQDTGRGINKEDLPRIFSKFQQFGRTHGPGEKGTGLGLSITKGIIELHKGNIWADSELDKGTKFTFVLPKYTIGELLKECIETCLKRVDQNDKTLSVFIIRIKELPYIQEKKGKEKTALILKELEGLVKSKIRRETDIVLENSGVITMLLLGIEKNAAEIIMGRIKDGFHNYFSREGLGEEISADYETVSFPQDGKSADELISKIAFLKNI